MGRSVGPVWPRGCPPRGCPKTLEKLKEYRTSLFLKSRFCIMVMYFFVTSWTCFGRLWPLFGPLVASRVHQDPQKENTEKLQKWICFHIFFLQLACKFLLAYLRGSDLEAQDRSLGSLWPLGCPKTPLKKYSNNSEIHFW